MSRTCDTSTLRHREIRIDDPFTIFGEHDIVIICQEGDSLTLFAADAKQDLYEPDHGYLYIWSRRVGDGTLCKFEKTTHTSLADLESELARSYDGDRPSVAVVWSSADIDVEYRAIARRLHSAGVIHTLDDQYFYIKRGLCVDCYLSRVVKLVNEIYDDYARRMNLHDILNF